MSNPDNTAEQESTLSDWIKTEIKARGRVPFAVFMQWALYHPTLGYYSLGPRIGVRGDFVTSPEASPAFGRLLALHVAEISTLLGNPETFDIVEFGPGNGTLSRKMLDTLKEEHGELYARTRLWLVEVSPALAAKQRAVLEPQHGPKVRPVAAAEDLPCDLRGAAIANEVVDAFPVHLLCSEGGKVLEEYVALGPNDELIWSAGEPSDPALTDFLQRYRIRLEEGERIEINLAVEPWIRSVASRFAEGLFTIIDYGDTSPGRYSAGRKSGTLLAYFGGAVTDQVLARPGLQDLTALVDFTHLLDASQEAGLTEIGMTRQANFLIGLGLGTGTTAIGLEPDLSAALAVRRGIQALVSPEGLGRFHVLLLGKGVDAERARVGLSGLRFVNV